MNYNLLAKLYLTKPVRNLAELAIRKLTPIPKVINLEVSRLCNLKCPNCYRRSPRSISKIEGHTHLTVDLFYKFIERMPFIRMVNFLGEGEPLMNPELDDIIREAASLGIASVFTTNATLVTVDRIREWEKSKVFRIYVSFDSPEPEDYEWLRPSASFEKVVRNLRLLGSSKIPITLSNLLYQETMPQLPQLVELCAECGIEEMNPLIPVYIDRDDNTPPLSRPKPDEDNYRIITEATELMKRYKIRWSTPPMLVPTFRRCNFPWLWPAITLEGDLFTCCYIIGRGRIEHYLGSKLEIPSVNYRMGNVFEQSFYDLWHDEAYKHIRYVVSCTDKQFTIGSWLEPEDLANFRESAEVSKGRFNHCLVCLWRWHVGC